MFSGMSAPTPTEDTDGQMDCGNYIEAHKLPWPSCASANKHKDIVDLLWF